MSWKLVRGKNRARRDEIDYLLVNYPPSYGNYEMKEKSEHISIGWRKRNAYVNYFFTMEKVGWLSKNKILCRKRLVTLFFSSLVIKMFKKMVLTETNSV